MGRSSSIKLNQVRPHMGQWEGVQEMRAIKQFFDLRHAQTWQIICESSTEEQVQKQFSLFMYSIYEKLVELCPIIKELLVDEGIFRTGQNGPKGQELEQQS